MQSYRTLQEGSLLRFAISALLVLLAVLTLYPFVYVMAYSLSDGVVASARTITVFPVRPTLRNYRAVLLNDGIMRAAFVSVSRTVLGSTLHLVVTSLCAYALSKERLVGKRFWIPFFVIPMYFSGGLLPLYIVVTKLGMHNSFLVYVIPMLFNSFHMLILRVFFVQLPTSLEESAKLDGAGDTRILVQIVMPMSLPVVATVLLFIGVAHWNSWFDTMLYITSKELVTLQALLQRIILESQTRDMIDIMEMMQSEQKTTVTPEAIKMATLMVATVPIIMIYPFLQRYFVKGLTIGAVKG